MTRLQAPAPVRRLFGVDIHAVTMDQALDICRRAVETRAHLSVGVVNAAKIVAMQHSPTLFDAVAGADLVLADGMAVVWAGKILRRPLPGRVTGIDLFERLLRLANQRGYGVYFLGATQDVLDEVLRRVGRDFPHLRIAGSRNGYFSDDQAAGVADEIRRSRADLLFVAMTSPKKELFLGRFGHDLNVAVCHGVGGSFDVLAGKVRRAPRIWQSLGLEWLYRVLQEPRRMWKRYLVTNAQFANLLAHEALRSPPATHDSRPDQAPQPPPSGTNGHKGHAAPSDVGTAGRTFDGVICFGDSDWWYHNRGHYDMQMMRQFARHVPVLYVNSIGVRAPSVREGGMFLHRLQRKIRSLCRGLVRVQPNFSVFSPLVMPGKLGMFCSKPLLLLQVRAAARRLGIRRPLLWVACPSAAAIVERLESAGVIYQRTDAYETLPGVDEDLIRRLDRRLKIAADITLFCSSYVLDHEEADCRNPLFVDHGVDFETFAAAGQAADRQTSGPGAPPGPRVGFVGGIDKHTFDPQLFREVVQRLPDVHFILVGACSLPNGWCPAPNVSHLGQKPYDRVADYMAACDVLIMPWNRSDWIRACNPVKLKEYLAVGRPVVSTPFEELRRYDGLVQVAHDADSFAALIRDALSRPPDPDRLRQRVRHETWQAKGRQVLTELARLGIIARNAERLPEPQSPPAQPAHRPPAYAEPDDAVVLIDGASTHETAHVVAQ